MCAVIDHPVVGTPTEAPQSLSDARPALRLVEDRPGPKRRDWSNVVFSPAFCEEAKREWEGRTES